MTNHLGSSQGPGVCQSVDDQGAEDATDVCGEDLVLGEDTVDGCTQAGDSSLVRGIAVYMVDGEVGAYLVADSPAVDSVADGEDLAGHVRARDEVLLLAERVLARGDGKVAVLQS